LRLIDCVSLNLRLKDLLGPVTRVKKKETEYLVHSAVIFACHRFELHAAERDPSGAPDRGTSLIRNSAPLGPYSKTMPRALWGS